MEDDILNIYQLSCFVGHPVREIDKDYQEFSRIIVETESIRVELIHSIIDCYDKESSF